MGGVPSYKRSFHPNKSAMKENLSSHETQQYNGSVYLRLITGDIPVLVLTLLSYLHL